MDKELLAKGTLLFHGTYRIEGKLGQGGFGITYLATDVALDKYVAIKEFFPNTYCKRDTSTSRVGVATEGSREFVTRLKLKFLKEARNIAKLDHPNIVCLHAAFEENDTAYYVMDYIEGTPLSQIVKTHGPLDRRKAVEYTTLIGNALVYLHKRRINHLDVKPANIMVRKSDGVPVLIDFGLAKQYDCEGQQTTSTPVGFSQGFAPVEQYKPGGVKEFSPASDLYSLAATLYFMLSGRIPPPATDLVDEPLVFPEEFPSFLKKPIDKAMSASRKSRHATVDEFLREINPDRQTPPPSPEEDTTYEDTTYEEPTVEATVDDDSSNEFYNENSSYSSVANDNINEPEESDYDSEYIDDEDEAEEGKTKRKKYVITGSIIAIIAVIILVFLWLPKSCGGTKGHDSDTFANDESIVPYDVSGEAEGHEYVDLGLPSGTLWATTNVGALGVWDLGDSYTWYGEDSNTDERYAITPPGNLTNISGTQYDAARKLWGGDWRVPTVEEVAELLDNTEYKLANINGILGGVFTAKNGNSIFIPCKVFLDGFYECEIWTATRDKDSGDWAYILFFGEVGSGEYRSSDKFKKYFSDKYEHVILSSPISLNQSIRPVMSPNRK